MHAGGRQSVRLQDNLLQGRTMTDTAVLFEVRAERADPRSRLWTWAIYRIGARAPTRRSMPIFETDASAIEAGDQVIVALQQRALRSSFVRPGV